MKRMVKTALAVAPCLLIGFWGSAASAVTLTLSTVQASGANTSYATAQMLDVTDATNTPLFNTALSAFDAGNSDKVHQAAGNYSLGTAQAVSPIAFPYGSAFVPVASNVAAHGTIATAASQQFYAFSEAAGANIQVNVNSTFPSGNPTELELYDPNGNLVAIAAGNGSDGVSSLINFTVPAGDGGNWVASALANAGASLVPFKYSLQVGLGLSAVSPFVTNVLGDGKAASGDPTNLGFYGLSANVGDNLALALNATGTPAGTELELYDPNGNLVAIAAGNGSDGLGSIINFTVPGGDGGTWYAEVLTDPNSSTPQPYRYDLAISGATGFGPINPSAVPEPGSWAMLVLGVAALGGSLRRRRSGLAAAGRRPA